jgi:hypothetical protein
MKLKTHKIDRLPGHKVVVSGVWTNQMRMPKSVRITCDGEGTGFPETLTEGDEGDVFNTLSGMAQIAWEMGWRPEGLANATAGLIAAYRLPKAS